MLYMPSDMYLHTVRREGTSEHRWKDVVNRYVQHAAESLRSMYIEGLHRFSRFFYEFLRLLICMNFCFFLSESTYILVPFFFPQIFLSNIRCNICEGKGLIDLKIF